MRVFVTGASGWIGSAVVPELIGAGHQVVGLARSDAAAERVAASGAEVLIGDVQDVDVLRAGAEQADGVVHLAFRHDIAWTGHFEEAAASDRRAIEVFGEVLSGSDGTLAVASGVAGVRPGGIATERDLPSDGVSPRVASERAVLALAERGVRSMSVRFAPTVHGAGDHGFIARIVDADRSHGAAGYVAEGENRWAAVHQKRRRAARAPRDRARARAARCCTPSARRASRCAISPRRSATASSSRRPRSRPTRPASASASSRSSSVSTWPPRARSRASCSGGSRRAPPSSRTSTRRAAPRRAGARGAGRHRAGSRPAVRCRAAACSPRAGPSSTVSPTAACRTSVVLTMPPGTARTCRSIRPLDLGALAME